jgi:hypothetical protein
MNEQKKQGDQNATNLESNWKEKFIAATLSIIGLIYLLLQITAIVQTNTGSATHDEGFIRFNKSELFSDIRSYITIILSLSGAILILRRKKLGWIFAVAVLALFIIIAGAGLITAFSLRIFFSFFLVLVAESVLLLALIFCLQPAVRKKMLTGKIHYLSAFALTAILLAVYIGLQ